MIKITFPDGTAREYKNGISSFEIAEQISPRLAKEVYAATVNGEIRDLTRPIDHDATLKLHKWEDEAAKLAYWHSSAHLMAEAMESLYPGMKFGIGPAIENGFYYDVDPGDGKVITESDLQTVENRMKELAAKNLTYNRREVSKKEALYIFKKKSDEYKTELINEIADRGEKITTYTCGGFTDLCRGGHTEKPAQEIPPDSFKLDRVAGAYWRGDEKNKMLTRIYGLAFGTKEELDSYLLQREEAEKRDHKKLGKELDLFIFSELVGSGLPLWTPKGTILRNLLDNFVWELREKCGYTKVEIPHITKKELYEKSGHWDKFKDELFRITTR